MKRITRITATLWLLSAAVSGAAAVPSRSASLENLRIKGVLMYDNEKSVENLGLYEYTVTSPISRRILTPLPRVYANGGSVVKDNKLYTYSYDIQYGYVNSARYYVYDLTSGEQLSSTSMGYDVATAYSHAAVSSAIDPTTGIVYSSGYEYNETDKTLTVKLKTWDLEGNSKTTIGDMQAPLIVMAFDKSGQLWGITASSTTSSADGGYLIKVDKSTGEQTLIGDTGVRPYYDQSAVIDPANGTFYWLANTQTEEANLYSVDLGDGSATLIGAFPNGDEIVAASINPTEYDDAAPSAAKNLIFTATAPYGLTVEFDMPTTSYDGTPLTGEIYWAIHIDGTKQVEISGKAEAGGHVKESVDFESSQQVEVTIATAKDAAFGPYAVGKAYVGYDKLKAVGNLKLTYAENTNTLTWEAPTEGYYNGLQATDGYRYRITRMPEGEVVAEAHEGTTFSEVVADENLRSTYYTVAAVNGDVTGDEATSNSVVTGSAITPPYSQDFTESNSLDLFTIVDGNADNNTWYLSVKSAKYRQSTTKSADDYLFMPAFNLKGGNSYELTFDGYGTNATRYTNLVDVVIATTPEAAGAQSLIDAPFEYKNTSTTVTNNKVTIKPETDGKYYIGFHIVSAKSQGTMTIDNIALSAGKSMAVPGVASDFNVAAGDQGALTASISITAPTTTAAGNVLDGELTLTLTKGETVIYDGAIAAGETKAFSDDTITESGNYTYSAYFSNGEGKGEVTDKTVYVGVDTPVAPLGVTLIDNNDGSATVSWAAVSEGEHGGYVNAAGVVYTILATADNSVIKSGITSTTATIDIATEGAQSFYSVKVASGYVENATSPSTASNEVLVGAAYTLPYSETFANATTATTPWTKEVVSGKSSDTSWSARADNDQNGDGGSADMTAYAAASSRWAGPKIDISGAIEPVVEAYVYLPDGNSRFTLQLQKDNGEWIDLASIDSAADSWAPISADLTAYKSRNVRLGLLGESLGGMRFIYVDNITIKDKTDGATALTAATDVEIAVTAGAIVVNAASEMPIMIYTPDGRCIASRNAQHASISVGSGVYIVKAGTTTAKVVL
ncbi:MAG: choice-of-anchor J domain-containing protein [Bacteroidales bacterium]|nr:choice-of-anchor J domain-containing protein [Bacteroidales bacterium]